MLKVSKMTAQSEHSLHGIMNLSKTLNALKRMTNEEDWHTIPPSNRMDKWLKAQSILAGIKQCRNTLQKVPQVELEVWFGRQSSMSHEEFVGTLDKLEQLVAAADQELKPRARRSYGILASLPLPSAESVTFQPVAAEPRQEDQDVARTLIPADNSDSNMQSPVDLLLEPANTPEAPMSEAPPSALLDTDTISIPESLYTLRTLREKPQDQTSRMPGFLQTSTALHEDLSSQLAEMAHQLKTNAAHFSESLAKDQNVVRETEEKLLGNYDSLAKERTRLKDHSDRSRGTSCLVFLSIVVVMVGFFATFFLIRIS